MDDARIVRGHEPGGYLTRDVERILDWQAGRMSSNGGRERFPLDQRRDQQVTAVEVLDAVQGGDVRVDPTGAGRHRSV